METSMEKPKSKVIKSKSSNSAVTSKLENKRKPEGQRKKSRSSGEFQTFAVKKRGVYVENKITKTSINARGNDAAKEAKIDEIQPIKAPPRPQRGSKRFLASVLTILSKSTTGTQYPDAEDKKAKIKKVNKETDPISEADKKKKLKYRSKILNDNKNQLDNFEVLQSKKDIVQTPSLYSERSYKEDGFKWSDLPRLVKPDPEEEAGVNHINSLVREVTEGRKVKEKKVKVVDPDPSTVIAEPRDDKRLYNFFVDLLETTFSVYNVNAEYDAAPIIPSAISSRIALEIDESVARKLNVATEMYDDVTQKPSKHYYSIRNENHTWNTKKLIDHFQPTPSTTPFKELPLKSPLRKRRLRADSFAFTRNKIFPPQSNSAVITHKKSFYRRNKKKDLLNILKEQLRMDHLSFEEPQNLYQALKVMAKNKRKTIRFDTSAKRTGDGYRPPECMLKRRKVISPSNKTSSKYDNEYMRTTRSVSKKFTEGGGYGKPYESTTDEDSSNHSLEVFGFDSDVPYKKTATKKELFMTYHSTPTCSEQDVDEKIKFSEMESNSTMSDY